MKKKLAVLGVVLMLVGLMLFVYFNPGRIGVGSLNSSDVHFSWAGIRSIQNGGSVYAHVLALRVPMNRSSITVVNNPNGDKYVFIRRGELYYPKRPIFFENLYVENLSWRKNVAVYYSSGDYLELLGVEENHLTVLPESGGLHIPCNSDGFKANLTGPRGIMYIGNERVMVFSNSSFRVENRTFHGKPLQVLLSYAPCLDKDIGYSVILASPGGGIEVYNGDIHIPVKSSQVTLASGFNFTNTIVLHNYTTYLRLKFGISCPHPAIGLIVNSLHLWLVLIILGAVLVLVSLVKR